MLPTHLISQLSPAAAKLYLALASLADRRPSAAPDTTLRNLCRICAFSRSTCIRALRQLQSLQLVLRDPQPAPRQPQSHARPPVSPMTPPASPSPVTPLPPVSPMTPPRPPNPLLTPVSTSRTPIVSPTTPLLTKTTQPQPILASQPTDPDQFLDQFDKIMANPELLQRVRQALGPETLIQLDALAQATLQRLEAEAADRNLAAQLTEPHP